VGEDDGLLTIIEHVEQRRGHHDLAASTGQRDRVRHGAVGDVQL
jgi:hypothetical protein